MTINCKSTFRGLMHGLFSNDMRKHMKSLSVFGLAGQTHFCVGGGKESGNFVSMTCVAIPKHF